MFIEELVSSKNAVKTKLLKEWWVNEEVIKIVSDFQSSFEAKGVKLIVCEKSQKGSRNKYVWIEYIDIENSTPKDMMDRIMSEVKNTAGSTQLILSFHNSYVKFL